MTATIVPIRKAPKQKPAPVATHMVFTSEAKMAFDSLKGRVSALDRIFAGPSAPIIQAAEIQRLLTQIEADAARVRAASSEASTRQTPRG